MLRLEPALTDGYGVRLVDFPRSPMVLGEDRIEDFAATLTGTWSEVKHEAERLHVVHSTPAEMILSKPFLDEAHRLLGSTKIVVGIPTRDAILAGPHHDFARVMVMTSMRYDEVPTERISPDLFVVENGVITEMMINPLAGGEVPDEPSVESVLLVAGDGEFHVTAGRDTDALLALGTDFIGFAAEKWLPDPAFSGACRIVVTAPTDMKPVIEQLEKIVADTGVPRLRFSVLHIERR